MTRPLTCLTLAAAAGAGLYLYQEKHHAQLLDREINRVVHATEQVRERTGMMRAEWALLNEPDRLAGLAAQHLSLQAVAPAQFAQLADLGSRLPPVGAPPAAPAPAMEEPAPAPAPTPAAPPPVAAAPPRPAPKPALLAQAAPRLPVMPPRPSMLAQAAAHPPIMSPPPRPLMPPEMQASAPMPLQHPAAPIAAQTFLARPAQQPVQVAAQLPDPAPRGGYAPFPSGYAAPAMHAPTVQQAAAGLPPASSYAAAPPASYPFAAPAPYARAAFPTPYAAPAPYVGSALGMSRSVLLAPAPVAVGSLPGR